MSTASNLAQPATISLAGKYLAVMLDQESYAVAVLKVREIIRHQQITPVPQMPEFVKGVINLRGSVIPVVDLRLKFGLRAHVADRACIVVVHVDTGGPKPVAMGLIVDNVDEVANISADQIEPTPDFGVSIDTAYILGMAKLNGRVKMLLDIDRVIAPETMRKISQPTAA